MKRKERRRNSPNTSHHQKSQRSIAPRLRRHQSKPPVAAVAVAGGVHVRRWGRRKTSDIVPVLGGRYRWDHPTAAVVAAAADEALGVAGSKKRAMPPVCEC